jgi:small subunit ribosomal protein S1
MPTPAPALPFVPKPQPILHVAKALVPSPRQTQPQARGRGLPQPVNCANSKRLDDALSAGFVRLLNAGQVQDADSASGTCRRYDPKPGDFAVGVVVSGTEARLDVAVGADRLATLLSKELLPLDRDSSDPPTRQALPRLGSIGVVAGPSVDDDRQKRGSRTLVAPGTVVFAEVLGRTLSGRPLLSARRLFRRLAWHRARQVECICSPFRHFVIQTFGADAVIHFCQTDSATQRAN